MSQASDERFYARESRAARVAMRHYTQDEFSMEGAHLEQQKEVDATSRDIFGENSQNQEPQKGQDDGR